MSDERNWEDWQMEEFEASIADESRNALRAERDQLRADKELFIRLHAEAVKENVELRADKAELLAALKHVQLSACDQVIDDAIAKHSSK